MALIDVKSATDFDRRVAGSPAAVVHFWAPWCEPCAQLDRVLEVLAQDHCGAFLRVEAEEVTEVSLRHEVAVVPLFLFFKEGKLVDRLEGADVAALSAKVSQHLPASDAKQPQQPSQPAPASSLDRLAPQGTGGAAAIEQVKSLIASRPVMLLMKGSPEAPRCGFSARTVAALQKVGVPFGHFDILTDEGVRQAAKVYSDWPSYPQLYVRGELVGGCDIVEEMAASGELASLLRGSSSGSGTAAAGAANGAAGSAAVGNGAGGEGLEARLRALVRQADVMLFMKTVQALRGIGVPFGHFDILQDDEVREGLKRFSQWPTYPQLYAGGELLGGCDIVLELAGQGALKQEIEAQLAQAQKADA